MDAVKFFNEVARPNISAAVIQDDEYRQTVNAILSIDAAYGMLFEQLKDLAHPYLDNVPPKDPRRGLKDSDFKDHIAKSSKEFAAIRDAAYATKHGRLGSKNRIVRSSEDIGAHELVCGLFSCGDRLGASAVFITTDGANLERSWSLLRRVELLTDDLLGELELAPLACVVPEYHVSQSGTKVTQPKRRSLRC